MPTSPLFKPYESFLRPYATEFFQQNIMRFVPEFYKNSYDGIYSLMELVAPAFDELYQYIIDLPDLADIDRCPARFLQYLSENIGVLPVEDHFLESLEVAFRRQELGKMKDSHSIRGVEYSFLRFLKYLGAEEYGLIYPYKQILVTDLGTLDGWSPRGERNDVGELLEPQWFNFSNLADGVLDSDGNLQGSRVLYTLPVDVIRSEVRVWWNEVEVGIDSQRPEGEIHYSFFFNRDNNTIITNFIPLIGDSLKALVVGDPFYAVPCRMEDAYYWRPGVTEVWCVDKNPLRRRKALEDRRPAGTLLYFAWVMRFLVTKCFPFPPEQDWYREGYYPPFAPEPTLPYHQDLTWGPLTPCDTEDPLWFQIINGYGFEAGYELGGFLEETQSAPYETEWSLTPEFHMEIVDDILTFYARSSRSSFFRIQVEE